MSIEEMHNELNNSLVHLEALAQSIVGKKFYTDAKHFSVRHPFIFTAIFCICFFSSVPLLFFLGFAVVTLFIALICFLCIEGSLIAIGGVIFVGVVSFIAIIVIALLSGIAVAYWVIKQVRLLLYSGCHRTIFNFVNSSYSAEIHPIPIENEKSE